MTEWLEPFVYGLVGGIGALTARWLVRRHLSD